MTTAQTFKLPIEGMTCASCVNRIDRFLRKSDGVAEVSVNLATESARVVWAHADATNEAKLKRIVRDAGYEPRSPEQKPWPANGGIW